MSRLQIKRVERIYHHSRMKIIVQTTIQILRGTDRLDMVSSQNDEETNLKKKQKVKGTLTFKGHLFAYFWLKRKYMKTWSAINHSVLVAKHGNQQARHITNESFIPHSFLTISLGQILHCQTADALNTLKSSKRLLRVYSSYLMVAHQQPVFAKGGVERLDR